MFCGIWLLIADVTPGFEGLEDLLPTKRLRGFAALVALGVFEALPELAVDMISWVPNGDVDCRV